MGEPNQRISGSLADSIAMLEQIIEVMPQDADTLRALYHAYCQGGVRPRAFEYLNRLVDVATEAGGAEIKSFVQAELASFEGDYPSEVAAQLARLRTLAKAPAAMPKPSPAAPSALAAKMKARDADISEELSLAWRLYEENQLSQEEYSSVLHDLTEVSSKNLDVPVSVLHVLSDRGFTQMNRIMNHLSTRSGVPCLSLANFELAEPVAAVLPMDIPAHDGALPFAFFGNDLLVGVLNPFNKLLLEKVEEAAGHRCHTFLVAPEDYDKGLGRLRALAAKA